MRVSQLFSRIKIPSNDNNKRIEQDQNFLRILSNPEVLKFISQNELLLEKSKLKEKLDHLFSNGKIKFSLSSKIKATKMKSRGK